MRKNRVIAAILSTAVAAALALSACDAPSPVPAPTVPIEATFTTSPIGQLLQSKGYTPVAQLVSQQEETKGQLTGAIYTNCGDEKNLTDCAATLHDRATMDKPNVYVEKNTDGVLRVTRLEGIYFRASTYDKEFMGVPTELGDFTKLSPAQLDDVLFTSMPKVNEILENASDPNVPNRFTLKVDGKDYGIDAVVMIPA